MWAVRARDDAVGRRDALLGWCGFAEPDIGEDPEVLYDLAPAFWGRGLATEAAPSAFDWLFRDTPSLGISASILWRLDLGSVAIAGKFGMTLRGIMPMKHVLPDLALARVRRD